MKAKGKISKIWDEEVPKRDKSGTFKKHFVFLEGDERKYGGFGAPPEDWKEGTEVEFEYEEKNGYFNIEQKGRGKGYSNFSDVVKALTMPKVSLFYDRTEQVKDFVPIKLGATVSYSAEHVDPKQAEAMIDVLTASVDKKLEEKLAQLQGKPKPEKGGPVKPAPSPSPATSSPSDDAIGDVLAKQESEDKNAEKGRGS